LYGTRTWPCSGPPERADPWKRLTDASGRAYSSSAELRCGCGPCPTLDGGYYGIACRKIRPGMLDGVRWATGDALQDTIRPVQSFGLFHALGREWFDVDTPEDLQALMQTDIER